MDKILITTNPSLTVAAAAPAPAIATPAAPALSVVPPAAAPTPAVGSGPPLKLLIFVALLLAAGLAFAGRLWWLAHHVAETENAFVAGHVHPVSARVAGVVLQVDAQDNAIVKAGQPLLVLDASDQQVQIERLRAQLAQVDAQIAGSAAQIAQARAQVAAAQAQTAQAAALQSRAQGDVERAQRLYSGELRAISKQELDAALATRDAAGADVNARRAAVDAASEQVKGSAAARESALAQRGILQVQLKDAQQQLGYMAVASPADGRIGKRTVEVGQRVQPGQQLLAVVGDEVWITANFKETQLAKMHAGQVAIVKIDAFPGQELHATVQSFAPASGASFALLPADNATGNFTKIVQRVPVKLLLDAKEIAPLKGRLVPGLSANVAVDIGG
jgi:membrane fusion protein, multidrug efflux system